MEILGVGPFELFFILIIALIVLGPKDMAKAGRTLGRMMRKVVTSENYRVLQQVSRELRTLPTRLMRDAGIDELQQQLNEAREMNRKLASQINQEVKGIQESANLGPDLQSELADWTTPPPSPSTSPQPSIRPPQEPATPPEQSPQEQTDMNQTGQE